MATMMLDTTMTMIGELKTELARLVADSYETHIMGMRRAT